MIAFEDIAIEINRNNVIDTIYNHSLERYPDQHLFIVMVRGYLYTVPFYQINDDTVYLVTAYPDGRRMRWYRLAGRYL